MNKNIFIDAQARYGKSYINKSSYNMNLSGDISYAKTESDLYGGKLGLYYDYITQGKVHIIPKHRYYIWWVVHKQVSRKRSWL